MKLINAVKQLEEISDNSINFQDSTEVVSLDKVIELVEHIYQDFNKKNTINVRLEDIEPFMNLINLLKQNINLLPTELKAKLLEILEK